MRFIFTITLMILVQFKIFGFAVEPPNNATHEELIGWINSLDPATQICDFSNLTSRTPIVTDEILTLLGKQCSTLEAINLNSCNSISYQGVASLARLCYPHLQQLMLYSSTREHPLGDSAKSFAEILRHCPNLKTVDFRDLYLSDKYLEMLSSFCPHLESIAFFVIAPEKYYEFPFQFTEQGLVDLVSSLPNLKQFNVHSHHMYYQSYSNMNQLSNRVLETIAARCPALSQLNVDSNDDINYGIQLIVKSCPELRKISYSKISGETLRVIGQYSQNFECLEFNEAIDNLHQIKKEDAIIFALGCPHLKVFSANIKNHSGKVHFSDSFLEALSSNCHQLISLTIEIPLYDPSSTGITEKGLAPLVKGCPKLQTLNLSGSGGGITDKSLEALRNGCEQLTFLNIAKSQVTASGLDKLLNDMPQLNWLNIAQCKKIKNQQVEALRKKYPNVIIKR